MRSLYMLLFNIPVIAEQWFGRFGGQMIGSHADKEAVLASLERPGALTASFGWYQRQRSPADPRQPAAGPAAGHGADDGCLVNRRHRTRREADDRICGVRHGPLALRAH